jgi:O-antigen ligase
MSSRIESLLDPDQHSNKHHYLESVTTLQDIMQTPLTGMGLGGVHSPVSEDIIDWPEEGQPVHVVHNTFIHVWMKLGLPGLLFFIWIGAVYLRTLNGYRRRAARNDTWPFLAGIASGIGIWLVMFITGPVPWYFHQTFLIALFSGICLNLIRLEGAEARHGEPATTSGANNV